jgi:hypothetical protein
MTNLQRAGRGTAVALAFFAMSACSNSGSLGNILGSVLGGGGGNELAGRIQSVDTRNQQLGITQTNGQTVAVRYDNQTRVIYNNENYPVTALESGDEVVARIQDNGNGNYYTDSIQVTQSVNNAGSGANSAGIQAFQGTVRAVDFQTGRFSINNGAGYDIIVSMPYNPSEADRFKFERLARGQSVRFYGVPLNSQRVELRQFY